MTLRTEQQTRKDLINPLLEKAGWGLADRTRVVEEVDTRQSDFKVRDYRTIDETLRNDAESAYVDYLLLDSMGSPLGIVEAKRTSRDPVLGQQQAEMYADDIKNQTRRDLFIFLTNGYEIWFWNRPHEPLRMVKGFHSREALEGPTAGRSPMLRRRNFSIPSERITHGTIAGFGSLEARIVVPAHSCSPLMCVGNPSGSKKT